MILLEQDLIFQHDIENKVCPILLALSAPDSDDECKAEAMNVSLFGEQQTHAWWLSSGWACDLKCPMCSLLASPVLIDKVAGGSSLLREN